jgi:D-beta-D-heptose 7-phosphate kinase/D-beta-D-heptose 1-phosphate adenosyltransferase
MLTITQQLKLLNVLVIGDYCIDQFSYGICQRLSPEAPVPVFDIQYTNKMEGMAGNVYKNLQNLGLNVSLIKNDETVIKTRFIDLKTKQHLLRVDENNIIKKIDIKKIKSFKYDAVVISDYDKGFITNDIIPNLLALFDCPIFVDSKKTDLSKYENCIIKINETEYNKVQKYPTNYKLIVTLGENGALYNNKIIPTNKVQVFDVSGAGDTFIASLVTKYLVSNDLEKSIKFANVCSSIVVTKSGTATINFEEIVNEI